LTAEKLHWTAMTVDAPRCLAILGLQRLLPSRTGRKTLNRGIGTLANESSLDYGKAITGEETLLVR
jgi:hypothetical protein